MESSDILITGAGPAGSAASLFLSREGISHTIIDKATFPRDKICGDALSGKVIHVLNQLDRSIAASFNDNACFTGSHGVRFFSPSGTCLDVPFSLTGKKETAPGFLCKREIFDETLFTRIDKKYAVVKTQTLLSVKRNAGRIEAVVDDHGKLQSVFPKLIISCEGDRSVVARNLGEKAMEPEHYCAGLRAYYRNVNGFHQDNYIELHFIDKILPGYFWIFPLSDNLANVGIGMLSNAISKRKINLKKAMLDIIANHPVISKRFAEAVPEGKIAGWGLPLGSKKRKLSGDGFMLAGDAASLIDPFTGEGIGNAMLSGMHAARTAVEAVRAGRYDAVFLKQYDEAIYNAIGNELKLSHTMQRLARHKFLFNLVVKKAAGNKAIREAITCMFEDLDMRAKLRNPVFYLRMLF